MMGVPFYSLGEFPASFSSPAECELCKNRVPVNTKIGHGKEFISKYSNN